MTRLFGARLRGVMLKLRLGMDLISEVWRRLPPMTKPLRSGFLILLLHHPLNIGLEIWVC